MLSPKPVIVREKLELRDQMNAILRSDQIHRSVSLKNPDQNFVNSISWLNGIETPKCVSLPPIIVIPPYVCEVGKEF
jgi:hypothetical protein